jgi:hypothetical protein
VEHSCEFNNKPRFKMLGSSWVATQLAASREGLSSLEIVYCSYSFVICIVLSVFNGYQDFAIPMACLFSTQTCFELYRCIIFCRVLKQQKHEMAVIKYIETPVVDIFFWVEIPCS